MGPTRTGRLDAVTAAIREHPVSLSGELAAGAADQGVDPAVTAVATPTTAPSTRPVLDHDPALDGLRGIAVAAVVAFHLGHLQGGFLGVDLFFTLSGYLITRLLLLEHEATGRVAMRAFWTRRAWRLLPALYLLVAALAVYAATVARPDELGGIRGPGISSLLFVSNWWFIADGDGYWDLFTAPSPLEHVWSLSIEQQFYVVWPLLAVAVLGSRRRRSWLLATTVVLAAGSTALLAVLARDDVSRAYFGSGARASSILVGAALAIVVDRGDTWLPTVARSRAAPWIGLGAAALLAWTWITINGATDLGFYTGGFLLHAIAVAAIIGLLMHHRSSIPARLLTLAPLRLLGVISYGVYLWHWPAIVLLDGPRTGLDGAALLLVRLGTTLALSVGSYLIVEKPAQRRLSRRWRAAVAFPIAAAAIGGALWMATIPPTATSVSTSAPPPPPPPLVVPAPIDTSAPSPTADDELPPAADDTAPDVEDAEPDAASVSLLQVIPDTLPVLRTPTASEPLRVLLVGDSYMYDAQPGIVAALEATGVVDAIEGARLGFALSNEGWEDTLQELVDEHRPDLVAAMWARFDVAWLESNDVDDYVARLDRATEILSSNGAAVGYFGLAPSLTGGVDQEPVDRSINQVFAATPERFPGTAFYVDPDPIVAPDGEPVRQITTAEGTLLVRKVDVSHFCSDGAARYGLAFTELLQRLTTVTPPDPAAWWSGPWRSDPRYNDPPGACS
jgi:peptidoglycan/LPS O-acetylase OafA/YrhL